MSSSSGIGPLELTKIPRIISRLAIGFSYRAASRWAYGSLISGFAPSVRFWGIHGGRDFFGPLGPRWSPPPPGPRGPPPVEPLGPSPRRPFDADIGDLALADFAGLPPARFGPFPGDFVVFLGMAFSVAQPR